MVGIVRHARLDAAAISDPKAFDHIAPPSRGPSKLPENFQRNVWQITEAVAARFGYAPIDTAE